MSSVQNNNELCWIHIRDVYTFLYLGANPHEQKVGQNLKIDLSVQVPYRNTQDSLENVVDYSKIIERVQGYIQGLGRVSLLEYLAEELLNVIENEFQGVRAARIVLYKAFVPLSHFTGSVAIEVEREFSKKVT
ncbi:MAG: dihydroneopterin aldolase [Pseudomonadota bacterium]|jgi:dihydroneopterin aldolase